MKNDNLEAIYPLTPMQEGMLFHSRYAPQLEVYFEQLAYTLQGNLDMSAFKQAWRRVVAHHPILRTLFMWENLEAPLQVVLRQVELPWIEQDWRHLPVSEQGERIQAELLADRAQGFDLTDAPLLRLRLIRLSEHSTYFIWSFHHLLLDGWSSSMVLGQVFACYEASRMDETLPLPASRPYRDYIAWLQRRDLDQAEYFWRQTLRGFTASTPLGIDWTARSRSEPIGDYHNQQVRLSESATSALQALARQHQLTLNTLVQGAWALLLSRYSGETDVVFGVTISGRPATLVGAEAMVGLFINTLPLRVQVEPQQRLLPWLQDLQSQQVEARQYEYSPLVKVQGWSDVPRGQPLFESLLIFANYPVDTSLMRKNSLEIRNVEAVERTNYPLSVSVTPLASMMVRTCYAGTHFTHESISRMLGHVKTVLEGMAAQPDARLAELPILTEAERHQLLVEWNATQSAAPLARCVHELFEQQVEHTPYAIALSFQDEQLTYHDLDARATRLAQGLRQLGVGPEVCVGLCLHRSPALIIGLLAILKAGGAYVPLDPAYPPERLAFMLHDIQADDRAGAVPPALVLTQQSLLSSLPSTTARVLCLDRDWPLLAHTELDTLPRTSTPAQLAYVIYTSGSTGRPKGTLVSHGGLANLVAVQQEAFAITASSRVLQFASSSFDAAVSELFTALLCGATLVLTPPEALYPGPGLLRLLEEEAITVVTLPPSVLAALPPAPLPGLGTLVVAGEACSAQTAARWAQGRRFLNAYGPTEASVCATISDGEDGHRIPPIGRPIANVQVYVLDPALRPVPPGVTGELYIASPGLARGYLHLPALTAERFLPHPFSQQAGARLYRTGDLVRYLPGGEIEYRGRRDGQVKVRGYRIELQEIEAALARHAGIGEVVVLARADEPVDGPSDPREQAVGGSGDRRLVAYLVAYPGERPTTAQLRAFLQQCLPDYMIPAVFVLVDALPRLPNGKVDRRALPAPGEGRPDLDKAYVAPGTPLEQFLAGSWQEVLKLDAVGLHDNFFELGGDSIKAAIAMNRVQERLDSLVYVVALFDAPTIAQLAHYLAEQYTTVVSKLFGQESLPASIPSSVPDHRSHGPFVDAEKVRLLRQVITPLSPYPLRLESNNHTKNAPAIFVLSSPRSGSTLLRVMLAGHPALFAPPELELLSFQTLGERAAAFAGRNAFWLQGAIRALMEIKGCDAATAQALMAGYEAQNLSTQAFYQLLQQWLGERLLVDKTPAYALDQAILRRGEQEFEGARYLHLVRHPQAVIRSFEEARLDEVFFRHPHAFTRRELAELIWVVSQQNIEAFLGEVPAGRQHRVVFEELVRQPQRVMEGICAFLGLEYDAGMLQPYAGAGQRMTDGIHPLAKMLGDIKFHGHQGIEAAVAERWREQEDEQELGEITWEVASALGYQEAGRPQREGAGPTDLSSIGVRGEAEGDGLPLSYAQQRLWFLHQWEPESAFYNVYNALRLQGPLNIRALEQSLQEIIRRHGALRTTFAVVEGNAVQTIAPFLPAPLPVVDLQAHPESEREELARGLIMLETQEPFDLEHGPLLRITLLRLGVQEHILLLTVHHIVSDGWSMGIFFHELTSIYAAFSTDKASPLPALAIQYADFAAWQRQWLQGEVLEGLLRYWRVQLANVPALLELPTDHPRPAIERFRGAIQHFTLPAALTERLKQLSQQEGTTLFMTLLAAFQTLLYRYTGQEDILVGTPIAGRTRSELEELIGCFINMLVLRTHLSGNLTFREMLSRVRDVALAAYTHQDLPFEQLVEELAPERSMSHAPLFQVMFVWQNIPLKVQQLPDLTLRSMEVESKIAKFDLTFFLSEHADHLIGDVEYNTDLFEPATISRMIGHYQHLLESIVAQPLQRLDRLPLLPEDEWRQIAQEWNQTEQRQLSEQSLYERFAAQVTRTPEAIALACSEEYLTYQELHNRATRLAHHLYALGVGSDTLVALLSERGLPLVTSILAVFQAGGAYVPLDPHHPAARMRQVLDQSGVAFVLTSADLAPLLVQALNDSPPEAPPRVLLIENLLDTGYPAGEEPLPEQMSQFIQRQLAYVIYTSGSTGKPKGAMVEQQGMLNHLQAKISDLSITADDVVAQTASQCFDISVWQMLAALLVGGRVQILLDDIAHDPGQLLVQVERQGVTILETVPSLLQALLEAIELAKGNRPALAGLRWLMPTGEALPPLLCRDWLQLYPRIPLINAYGPTECSDDVTHYPIVQPPASDMLATPIGRAIANTRLYVLDSQMEVVPVGVYGELYVGGQGVGRGYLGDPWHTAEVFLPDPFNQEAGARLYKTGDVVRYLPNSTLEYRGRVDQQVKVRGYRIELGEIETILAQHPTLREAVVVVREDNHGDKHLIAYVLTNQGQAYAQRDLFDYLQQRLPDYMLPSAFVHLEALPLTSNGKLDRRALPDPDWANTWKNSFEQGPRTPIEEILAELWAQVLGVEQVGIYDNFFESGGHSLLATQIIARVRDIFQIEMPLRSIFIAPTIAGLADQVETLRRSGQGQSAPPITRIPREGDVPLSFTQQRLWFLDQLEPESSFYNVPIALRLSGSLHHAAFALSLNEIVRRHEVLRTTFVTVNGYPAQIIASVLSLPLPVADLSGLVSPHRPDDLREQERALQRCVMEEVRRPFDLSRGPLIRSSLLRLSAEEHVLLLTLHHIVSDGWSTRILFQELAMLYTAYLAGKDSPLPELPIQFADFAAWQQQWLEGWDQEGPSPMERQLAYWKEQLAGIPPVLELPTDHPRPAMQTFRGAHQAFSLPPTLGRQLQALSRQEGVTLYITLLAAFQLLLARYSGQEDIVVGTPIANRTRTELEGMIGCFFNTLALRTQFSPHMTVKSLLRQVRETTLEAHAHQDLPFEKLVGALHLERDQRHNPIFQVLFTVQNAPTKATKLADFTMQAVEMEVGTVKVDLILTLVETGDGLEGRLGYNLDLFEQATITRMIGHLQTLLEGIAAHPEARLADLPILTEAERHQLLVEWNATQSAAPLARCVHELFEQQVEHTPYAIALSFQDEQLTYHDLDARATRLAQGLRQLGVGPEVCVGLCLHRSPALLIGLLAILKAGGAYVPLDPAYPPERLAFMLHDIQADDRAGAVPPALVLTQQSLLSSLPSTTARVLCLDRDWPLLAHIELDTLPRTSTPAQLAYVIYTSGSTGRPKGTLVSHGGLANLVAVQQEAFAITASSRVLQFASSSFDAAVSELFTALLCGATLVLTPPEALYPGPGLLRLLEEEAITVVTLPPSVLAALPPAPLPGLDTLVVAGEACSAQTAARWAQGRRFLNAYGPTEASVCATISDGEDGHRTPPIGRPIANVQVYVLDAALRPVPPGVTGELYIASPGLARGYLHLPALTAECFLPHPFSQQAGARLYRTGDLVRYLPGGEIEYRGRRDGQVKVRGYRIELEEIEAALARHAGIGEVVVLARAAEPLEGASDPREQAVGGSGDRRLVAYLVAYPGERPTTAQLRAFLQQCLPDYMIPAVFVLVDALPRLPNGKVDRRALPVPGESRPDLDKAYVVPGTPLEQFLAGSWQEVLKLNAVGIHDNFFELGGDSIKAAIAMNRVQERLGSLVYVVALFDAPTIAQLAHYLASEYPVVVRTRFGVVSLPASISSAASPLRRDALITDEKVQRLRQAIAPLTPRSITGEPRTSKNPPAIFVLSSPRSGSTLLRVMLAGHPQLFAPPELELLSFQTLGERAAAFAGRNAFWLQGAIRALMEIKGCDAATAQALMADYEAQNLSTQAFYQLLQQWLGERLLVDKTPAYALDQAILRRGEQEFEGARYLHLVRHPQAVIRSFEEARLDEVFFRHPHAFTRRELAELIWVVSQQNIEAFLGEVPAGRQHRVVFEELVRQPQRVMEGICAFLGLEYDAGMLQPYAGQRMTDSIHPLAKMLGDIKFHGHQGIEAAVAERWREQEDEQELGEITWEVASALGYQEAGRPQREGAGPVGLSSIGVRGEAEGAMLPLSYAQQRLWFLHQWEPESAAYNISSALRLEGTLNIRALEQSLNEIVRRHEVLRTAFPATNGNPVQVIAPAFRLSLLVVDLCELPEAEREEKIQDLAREEARRPFDLSYGSQLRVTLLRVQAEKFVILLTMHHIISDGWSMSVFYHELTVLYEAFSHGLPSPLPALPIQYADFALWQHQQLQGARLHEQLRYWKQQLLGIPALLVLPTDHPRPTVQTFAGAAHSLVLPADLSNAVKALSQREGMTMFATLLAAFQTLLSRYTQQDDISVGTYIAGRTHFEVEPLIGFFINNLVLRTNLSGNPPFREVLQRARAVAQGAYAHQDLPFEHLLHELQPERNPGHPPLFQVMLNYQNMPYSPFTLPGLTANTLDVESGQTHFDLSLWVAEEPAGLHLNFQYNRDLFEVATIQHMAGHFQTLLDSIVANPDQHLSELKLLSPAERHSLLSDGLVVRSEEEIRACTLDQLFDEQVSRTPESVALVFEEEQFTYLELQYRASQLAQNLQRLGVGPEVCVGLCLERSPELIIGLLAILKAGGAYVPLDPTSPPERLALMLQDTQAPILLTRQALLPNLSSSKAQVLCLDRDWPTAVDAEAGALSSRATGANLAYVIYTSGSTGRPKGVAVSHGAVAAFTHSAVQRFGLQPGERVLQFASLSFDASAEEIYPCLSSGGTLVLRTESMLNHPALFLQTCRQWGLSVLDLPTAYWQELVAALGREAVAPPPYLRLVIIGGEAAMPEPLARWQQQAGERITLLNTYGPTETTVVASVHQVSADAASASQESAVIGRVLPHVQGYVLDRYQQPVPLKVPGELYIGGDGLARGYLGRPDLTAERFVPDPFCTLPGARLYRSGDRVRLLPRSDAQVEGAGALEYQGRIDRQVKLRGYRIELGEIEAVLSQHAAVREVVVLLREDRPGDKQLVAYVVADRDEPDLGSQLRTFLQLQLPAYMLPSAFVQLDALPLTFHGKIDRRALPAPEWRSDGGAGDDSDGKPPWTPTEELLANTWSQVLRVELVRRHDQFFDLGGHSLLATQVVARVRELFGVEMSLRTFFDTPTLSGLAQAIDTARREGQPLQIPSFTARPRVEEAPLSYAQQRLWFLDQFEPGSPSYNIPLVLRLNGRIEFAALEESFNVLIRRHETLRTTFVAREGRPAQIIAPPWRLELPLIDLSDVDVRERERECHQLAQQETQRPFDLAVGPLLRARLLRLGVEEHVLLLTLHHIITDAWSMGIFVRELTASYRAMLQGEEPALPELALQYADFALWQRQWLEGREEGQTSPLEQQVAYWREQLAGAPPLLDLPTDHPRPAIQTFRGAHHAFMMPQELTERLRRLSRQEGVTVFMTLLAAFQVLLSRYSGQEDVVVGTPIANRRYAEVEGLIGFFINTLALRTTIFGELSCRALLRRVREVALEAYAHQDLPFEKLVDALHPERMLNYTPLFQVMFVLQNASTASLDLPDLQVALLPIESGVARFDLTLTVHEGEKEMLGVLEYNLDLFEPTTIERMAWHLRSLLEGMAAHPDARLADLPLLREAERQQLLAWNATTSVSCPQGCLHERFEAQAARAPESIALVWEEQQITYGELNTRANHLAHYLQRLGVGPEVPVGLCLQRSSQMIVGILAILKAGGAYVPLDPAYPAERLAFQLKDAQVALVLTDHTSLAHLPASVARIVDLEGDWPLVAREGAQPVSSGVLPEQLAYVIYTSGSTGHPKGVMVSHAQVTRLFAATDAWFHFDHQDCWTLFHSCAFDFSVWEIWGALLHGGRLVIVPYWQSRSPAAFADLLHAQQVTVLNQTPSAFRQLIGTEGSSQIRGKLRWVIFGGEALDPQSLQPWFHRHGDQAPGLVNMYGITETTVHVTSYALTKGDLHRGGHSPIGRPLPDLQVYVLDAYGQPVPIGVVGEMYVGGAGVARGYLKRPELSAERFVPDPFSQQAGARLYKSGDRARYRPDGTLDYLGRADAQVKLRGFRVELGEIEAVLSQHSAVQDCVVLLRKDGPAEQQLVAYVVSRRASLTISELRHFLQEKLPTYMLPAAFVFLPELPLTSNGKLDRRALPSPDGSRPTLEHAYVAPQTPVEELLATIWTEVLGLTQIGIHDNFFALGGDSILSLQIVAKASAAGLPLTPRHLFQHQTIAQLAALIGSAAPVAVHAEQALVQGSVPLTPIQHWFFQLELLEPQHWNLALLLQVCQPLSPALLQQAVHTLLLHHDALRLRAQRKPDGWLLRHASPDTRDQVPFLCVDLSSQALSEQTATLQEVAAGLQASLDLTQGPLVRVALFHLGPQQPARLLLVVHHLVMDIVSWQILLDDLQRACRQLRQGQPVRLPAKTTSFQHWAQHLQAYAQSEDVHRHLDFWLNQPWEAIGPLPLDGPGGVPASIEGSARTLEVVFSPEETEALLTQIPSVYHTQMLEVLLTALVQAMAGWTGRRALVVQLEGHGREDVLAGMDLTRTVGWFTTLAPVVLSLPEAVDAGVEEALKSIKEQVRRVPQHGLSFGLLRHLSQDEGIKAALAALPQPQVVFNYGGRATRVLAQDRLLAPAQEEVGEVRSKRGQRPYVLEINGGIADGRLYLEWTYSQQLHGRETIERLALEYMEALRAIIAHCQSPEAGGYTPSDFPLAQLDEQKLRELSLLMNKLDKA